MDKEKTLWVNFNWPIEPKVRHEIENILDTNGYSVHGGGTNLIEEKADISLHKK